MDCRNCVYYQKKICKASAYVEHRCHYVEEEIDPTLINEGVCDFFVSMEEWLND